MPKVPLTDADRFSAGRDTVLVGLPFETAAGLNRLQTQEVRIAREATAADAWLAAMAQLTAVLEAGAPAGFTRNFLSARMTAKAGKYFSRPTTRISCLRWPGYRNPS